MGILKKLKQWVFGSSPSSEEEAERKKAATIRDQMRSKYIRHKPRRRDKNHSQSRGENRPPQRRNHQRPEGRRGHGGEFRRPYKGRPPRHGAAGKRPSSHNPAVPRPEVPREAEKPSPQIAPKSVLVGVVTHYYSKVHAAAIKLDHGDLKVGDLIHFMGKHTVVTISVRSLQMNRQSVETAVKGDEVGVEVKSHVHPGDKVFKVVK